MLHRKFSLKEFLLGKNIWVFVLLLILSGLLLHSNYQQGTYLIGWDNISPELNPLDAIIKSLNGVWLEYRGLGLYDGQSQIANLFHSLIVYLMTKVIPQNLIRYIFILLLHLLGTFGIYKLIEYIFRESVEKQKYINVSAFLGALWYMLNIGTIQMFYTPLEAFAFHFTSLPFISLYTLKYLREKGRKNLFYLFLVLLFTTPQYFIPTLLLPNFILLFVLITIFAFKPLSNIFLQHTINEKINPIKSALAIGLVWICVNFFWLVPYLVGLPNNSRVITNAKINQMSTEEVFLRNKEFGNLFDTLSYHGISLKFEDYYPDGSYGFLMENWIKHLDNIYIKIIEWIFVIVTLFGLAMLIKTLRNKHSRNISISAFGFIYIICLILLANNTPVISSVMEQLQKIIPLFREAYRYPFTKFIHLFVFCGSILFSYGALIIAINLHKIGKYFDKIFVIMLGTLILIYTYPSFQGQFFHPLLRVKIPEDYKNLFSYFQEINPNSRVALLPESSYWSWKYYNFGYRGSGFLWYGIPQPIMERAFDPWSQNNENYYWELSLALYKKDIAQIENVFSKYNISKIIFDKNISTVNSYKSLFIPQTIELLEQLPGFNKTKQLGNIFVFEKDKVDYNFVTIAQNIPNIYPGYKWNDYDAAYKDVGTYKSSDKNAYDLIYPFPSLFSKKNINDQEFNIEENNEELIIISKKSSSRVSINKTDNLIYDTKDDPINPLSGTYYNPCGLLRTGETSFETEHNNDINAVKLIANNQRGCLAFNIDTLWHKDAYLVVVESKNISGRSLTFSIGNITAQHTELETILPPHAISNGGWNTNYFVLPPLSSDGLGYSIYIINDAIGNQTTVNEIRSIRFYKLPYDEIINHEQTRKIPQKTILVDQNSYQVTHVNSAKYIVNLGEITEGKTIILSQSYDTHWGAWVVNCHDNTIFCITKKNLPFIFGKYIKNHILINNWANGWSLRESELGCSNKLVCDTSGKTIILFFWPQILEWMGLGLLFLPLFWFMRQFKRQ